MAVTFGAFSGAYFGYPSTTGRMFPKGSERRASLMLVGSNIFYFTQMMVGIAGMPQTRYADYPAIPEWVKLRRDSDGRRVHPGRRRPPDVRRLDSRTKGPRV